MRKVFLYLSLISTVCFSAISRDFTYDGLTYTVLSKVYLDFLSILSDFNI